MRRSEIRIGVEGIVQDISLTREALNGYINKCILYVGAWVDIPELKRIDIVKTVLDQAYVPLLVLNGSSGRLCKIRSSNGKPISVFPGLEQLMDKYDMDEVGAIEAATLEGSTLWYQRVPETVETLTVLCYRDPTVLTGDNSVPIEFPAHLHNGLFVHGTAWMIYDDKGKKADAVDQFWHSFDARNKHSPLIELREWLIKNKRHENSSSWR